jgi:predicted S18 family serine protease
MIKIPVLAVDKDKGVLVDLELKSKKGKGTLFLDIKLCPDQETRQAMNTAFSLLKIKKKDILVRIRGDKHNCLCGGSLALPVYLGMYACIRGLKFRPKTFDTGCINKKGKITSVGGLAEKIRVILGKADVLLVPKGQGLPIEGIKVKEVLDLEEAIRIALIN